MFTKLAKYISPSLRKEEGFTLIELLIVVAIIAILAAIAIPQFSAYRIRAFNSAGNSDLRNIKIAAEAFVTDWQVYASSKPGGLATAPDATSIRTGPGNISFTVTANTINTTFPSTDAVFTFGVSNGVVAELNTTLNSGAAYTAGTAHTQGDIFYAADSDLAQLKRSVTATNPKVVGTAMVFGNIPVSSTTTGADDLPTANWSNL